MKTRNGFVSNSSSSSFIIAIKKNQEACKCCGRKDPDFFTIVDHESIHNDYNRVKALDDLVLTELEHLFKQGYFYSILDSDYLKTKKNIENYLKDGWSVGYVDISNHSEVLFNLKNNLIESGNAVVLYTDY
jgi:hypothetical protein